MSAQKNTSGLRPGAGNSQGRKPLNGKNITIKLTDSQINHVVNQGKTSTPKGMAAYIRSLIDKDMRAHGLL